jgi:two-component system sensor histidine kinase/response regulator
VLRGAHVLIAEDNPVNQAVARELLESEGVNVHIAGNGRAAIDAVASDGTIDVVLMDLQMPKLDGIAATREIRANPAFARLPIIAMTAHAMAAERDRCLEAGMNDYLSKPFDPARLYELLGRWLSQAREVRAAP